MLTPIEIAANTLCPAVRAIVVERLRVKGYTQKQIAAKLGLTQQCVSNYVVGCRAISKRVLDAEGFELVEKIVRAIEEDADELTVTLLINEACLALLRNRELWGASIRDGEGRCPICKAKNTRVCVVAKAIAGLT